MGMEIEGSCIAGPVYTDDLDLTFVWEYSETCL